MKGYEDVFRYYLPRRMPMIVRVDGRAFHTFTKFFKKPFDDVLSACMKYTATELCREISGAKLAYAQSDEISVLITDYDNLETQPWFDKNLQKITSVSAALATISFDRFLRQIEEAEYIFEKDTTVYSKNLGKVMFDARAFVLPKEEVANYFVWRQNDAIRNGIQAVAQAHYSQKELLGCSCEELKDKLAKDFQLGMGYFDTHSRQGICVIKKEMEEEENPLRMFASHWVPDLSTPIFKENREYIERFL